MGAAAGIALVASSLLTPYTGTFGYFSMNQPTLYFLLPVSTTMTMTSFNGSAQLVISPVGPGLSSLSPIVNITVVPKETVTFNVPVRGFYQIALDRPPGATQSAAISLIQTGVPVDLFIAGVALIALGGFVEALARIGHRRSSSGPEVKE